MNQHVDPREDRNSDRYVEAVFEIEGRHIMSGVYASPEEAVYQMNQINGGKKMKSTFFAYSKRNHMVMMSGRFNRAKRTRQITAYVSPNWARYPVVKMIVRGRREWNYRRPFGTPKRPTKDFYYAEDVIRRLKGPIHLKKPLVVFGVDRHEIPDKFQRARIENEQMIAQIQQNQNQ